MRRRRLILAVAIGLLFVALLLLGGYWAFVFYVALATVGLAWAMTYPSLARLEIQRHLSAREVEVGDHVRVTVSVTNSGLLPLAWLLVEDLVIPPMETEGRRGELAWLMPGGRVRLRYQLRCPRRGYFRIGPLFAEAGDYFGLLRRYLARGPYVYLTVRPRPRPLGQLVVPTSRPVAEVKAPFALLDDPTRPAGVREYRRGDPLRRLHWKATAHTGRLHSRVYEPAVLQGATILLDFHEASWPEERAEQRELAVTVAASLAAHLQERNQHFALVSNGLDGARLIEAWPTEMDARDREQAVQILAQREPPQRFEPVVVAAGRGHETLDLVLGALARLQPGNGLTMPELIEREHPAWSRELAALLIVPDLKEELLGSIGVLRAARFAVGVVLVGDQAHVAPSADLGRAGVRLYYVRHEEELAALAL